MNGIILSLEANIWIALSLFVLVFIYAWAKEQLGSAKLAIIFAAIIVYLTFFQYPELVWVGVILFLFATFGKELLDKVEFFKK